MKFPSSKSSSENYKQWHTLKHFSRHSSGCLPKSGTVLLSSMQNDHDGAISAPVTPILRGRESPALRPTPGGPSVPPYTHDKSRVSYSGTIPRAMPYYNYYRRNLS